MAKPGTAPAVLTILLATGLAVAAEWWEKKPYTQWSDKEVQRMIDNSPWGKVHTVTIMNPTTTGDRSYQTVGSGDLEREKKNLFHLHFLTAKPIRLAIARRLMSIKDSRIQHYRAASPRFYGIQGYLYGTGCKTGYICTGAPDGDHLICIPDIDQADVLTECLEC